MKKETASIIISFGGALLFFFGAFGLLKLHWLAAVVLAAGVYGALLLVTRPKRRIGFADVEALPGGEILEQKLQEAREDFSSIGHSMEAIEDPAMKLESERLHHTAGRILSYLEENPDKIMLARQFIDYYQDMASRLLDKYVKLQERGLDTEKTTELKEQTGKALLALNRAFEGQFEKLMQDEIMDMDADIRLLKQTMRMEGYEEEED